MVAIEFVGGGSIMAKEPLVEIGATDAKWQVITLENGDKAVINLSAVAFVRECGKVSVKEWGM